MPSIGITQSVNEERSCREGKMQNDACLNRDEGSMLDYTQPSRFSTLDDFSLSTVRCLTIWLEREERARKDDGSCLIPSVKGFVES